MIRYGLLLLLLSLDPDRAISGDKPPDQWLVVTAPAFRAALEPLCEHRKAQGMQVVVVSTTDVLSAQEIRAGDAARLAHHVHKLYRDSRGTSYVLLVGAVESAGLEDADKKVLPPLRGTISRMKGQPSDNGYGCPDQDLVPTVAVGRWPARTVEEARHMVKKTLAFEQDTRPGEWRRRLTVLAGVPAFNPFVDKLVETLALARLQRIDPSWSGRAIYHNAQSRFCVPDDILHDRALEYVQAGQACTLYLGHSGPEGLYAGRARYLDRTDWARLKIDHGKGVFATFGCNGCQLTGPEGEGYGVAAMRNPDGPVAVLGSHGICFAAMVQLAADAFFDTGFTAKMPEHLGDLWLAVKTGLARGKIDGLTFRLLDQVDGDGKIPQAMQRLEHVEMFLLLGDPALRLPALPADVKLTTPDTIIPGKTITVTGRAPARLAGARVRLTLERPLTSEPADLEPLPTQPEEQARVMLVNHDKANRFIVETKEVTIKDGRFETLFTLPANVAWPRLTLRAYAATKSQEGMGVLVLTVQK